MTRTDGTRDAARRLAGLDGRVVVPVRPAPPPGRLDPPTVPLPPPPVPGGAGVRSRGGRGTGPAAPWPAAGDDATAGRTGPDVLRPDGHDGVGGGRTGPGRAAPGIGDDLSHGGRPSWARRIALRWLPPSLAGARVDPGRPGALALVAVVLVGAVVAGVGVWANRPTAQPVAGLPPVTAAPAPAGPSPAGGPAPGDPVAAAPVTTGPLVVSVVGKVARPGLVRVPDGARVADAVGAAGGALPGVDLAVLNLARRVGDGEQIAIGVPPAPDAAPVLPAPGGEPASGTEPGPAAGSSGTGSGGGAASGGPATGGKVDLNSATAAELDALPGVGPVTATKIIDWRTANGRFSRVEQLREIEGIGERRFARLQPLVTV